MDRFWNINVRDQEFFRSVPCKDLNKFALLWAKKNTKSRGSTFANFGFRALRSNCHNFINARSFRSSSLDSTFPRQGGSGRVRQHKKPAIELTRIRNQGRGDGHRSASHSPSSKSSRGTLSTVKLEIEPALKGRRGQWKHRRLHHLEEEHQDKLRTSSKLNTSKEYNSR